MSGQIRNIQGARLIGRLWWKKRWFSICSAHGEYNEACGMCKAGYWKNVWQWKLDKLVERVSSIGNKIE